MSDTNDTKGWAWWAGPNEETYLVGPCATRERAIAEAASNGFGEYQDAEGKWRQSMHVCEARQDPVKVSDYVHDFEVDRLIESADENFGESDLAHEDFDGMFNVDASDVRDLETRICKAIDEWQAERKLVFTPRMFTACRNEEHVDIPVETEESKS